MKIAPSILSADFANLERDVRLVENGGADYIHVDVMDGHFVPNITLGANIVSAIRPVTKLPLDCHLMIENPENYIEDFAKAGADIITVHVESTPHIHRAIQMIKAAGVKAGVVLNPGTPVEAVKYVLAECDLVLVMTVNPGFGGQSFIEETLEKITELSALKEIKNYHYEIEVDGGIVPETAAKCKLAGADVFVAGSYVYNAENPLEQIQNLKDALK
ncbi:ribulose-phosphate 3-epimerase [Carnobacterium maltaromaticum]|uniref:ribulose-phosphate 3-epimerase n=1 Tax=Carnobacterium maltaromaticum TaxID=2751 RepID=UPI000C7770E1|nr:ribulose-phosphate 3-epimerase [Carnobacterium maltaromaticum]PLS38362.1 ribulose-phosphate 3-epimerase [Carnobacterium maltaromaticum]PLS38739.1 ribulose-phosphate 3-epimerase [Carnobacterium maltaromaticum]PLS39116.1 ribulose-phosphate 3-epimerase [Carnobacterium maltaromaticum]PLS45386.1 ribulose-phosphate 3-epimerase [Carnobacterium maltaromaticum]PLS48243.1 ribulose-phosphate 3-epimerase [Carnobacterium maltaromaticum]